MDFKIKHIVFIIITFYSITCSIAQVVSDSVYSPQIKTLQLHKDGWEMTPPFIALGTEEKIRIAFDDMNNTAKNYCYTIYHCNSSWEKSDLSYSEFADGFEQNQILDPKFSTNTMQNYIHYTLAIPNENCTPRISGNYIIKVFENFDTAKTVFTKRFYISENTALVNLEIMRPEIAKYMMKYQQFKIYVTPNISDYIDLKEEIKTTIIQNNNPLSIKHCYLSRLEDKTLVFDDLDSNHFEAGNEFRNFDIKSVRYQSARIQNSSFVGNMRMIDLYPDEWRNKKQYFSDIDINGKFYIENSMGVNKNIDADYNTVHISLPTPEPFLEGGIYVLGALTNWQCNSLSKMKYNFRTHAYEIDLLLKQGFYNYQFAYKNAFENTTDIAFCEGNHYETENDYTVFVYYKSMTARYERLIGIQMANSMKK
jgi:hypothetical protein